MQNREIGGRLLFLQLLKRNLLQHGGDPRLHPGQLPLIEALLAHPGSTQQELATRLHVTAASVALSAKRLQNAGLAEKRTDETDRRRNRLYATEEAERLARCCRQRLDEIDETMLAGFSEADLATLSALLDRMIGNLGGSAPDSLSFPPCPSCDWKENNE